jgi:uncharacterized protein (TIGR03083 family)
VDYYEYCDELENEGARFVARATVADVAAPVPGCPDWRVSDLLAHVGFVHRWARQLVAIRASERVSPRHMEFSRGPVSAQWLSEGVGELLETLRVSDPDDNMWAWGADQHVRFWARRQLHETLVHRVDLEESMAVTSEIDPHIAIDAIDEFLANLECAGAFSPAIKNLVGTDKIITFRADEGPEWSVRLSPGGFVINDAAGRADAVVSGPATDLLLTLYRRTSLADSPCAVLGETDLVATWLANSALL